MAEWFDVAEIAAELDVVEHSESVENSGDAALCRLVTEVLDFL